MKFTIVTVCFNSEATIWNTLESVATQSHPDIEHIIIDGCSTDRTLDVVRQFPHVANIVSEPDNGLYEAMNKGIGLATGEIVMILNSDDFYCTPDVIEQYNGKFLADEVDAVYSDLEYVSATKLDVVKRRWLSGDYSRRKFLAGWMPAHPTFALRRKTYLLHGVYNTKLTSASDYELMLRILYRFRVKASYLPRVTVRMRVGGKSNLSLKNRVLANIEDRKAWKINGLSPRFYTLFAKPLSKLYQFV